MTVAATTATSSAHRGDRRARVPPAVGDGVPDAEHGHGEADLLLRQAGRTGAEGEGQQAVLVEEPDRAEQERRRERDGVEVVDDEPLGRRIEEVDEREARAPPVSVPRCLRASRKTGTAPSATATACTTSSMSGLGHSHHRGARRATSGSKWAPSREIWWPWRSVISRKRPWAVDQTAWVRLPTSKRPVSKARCWRTASADMPAAKAHTASESSVRGRVTLLRSPARARSASGRRAPPRWPAPRTSSGRRRRSGPRARRRRRGAAPRRRGRPGRRRARAVRPGRRSAARWAPGVSAVTSGVAQASA